MLSKDKFSVEIHHKGLFCGIGDNSSYIDEVVDTFNDCSIWFMMFIGPNLKSVTLIVQSLLFASSTMMP